MAKPGPRPQPTSLKVIRGNPGKRKLNSSEPQPDKTMPEVPEALSDEASAQWELVAPQLHSMGVLTRIDSTALEMYCVAFGNWRDAQAKIQQFGPLIKSEKTGFFTQSPYMQIANKAFEQMRAMISEFGMTPSSRSRLIADKGMADTGNRFAKIRK